MQTFTTGLGAGIPPASTLDDRAAQALGLSTNTGFTIPVLGASGSVPSSDSLMLWIGVAGLIVAVATYYKKGR